MKKIFLTSLLILFTSIVYSAAGNNEQVSIEASLSPAKATVGIMLIYRIIISGSGSADYDLHIPAEKGFFPDKRDDDSKGAKHVPLYIIGDASREESKIEGSSASEIKVEITYYRTGEYKLPLFKVIDKSENEYSYKAPEVIIESINNEAAFADIESPLSLSGNYTRLYLLIAGILIFAIFIYFLIKFFSKKRGDIKEGIPVLSPLEIFMIDLKKIDAPKLISEGKVKKYVFDLSILFRKYISALYQFDAAEMTTDEISRILASVMPDVNYKRYSSEIINIMNFWDLSKFAEFSPSNELLMDNYNSTLTIAEKLSPWKEGNNA